MRFDQHSAHRHVSTTTGIRSIRACHSHGPVSWMDTPVESIATVTHGHAERQEYGDDARVPANRTTAFGAQA